MGDKTMNTRVQNKHDLEVNWQKAINFKPLAGELIVYDAEKDDDPIPEGREYRIARPRFKIGDGINNINTLPFSYGVGISSEEGGEIFNSYTSDGANTASSAYTHAEGFNTAAGAKGFKITAIDKPGSDSNNWVLTLDSSTSIAQLTLLNSLLDGEESVTASIKANYIFYSFGQIVQVNVNNKILYVTGDMSALLAYKDKEPDSNYVFIDNHLDIGDYDIGKFAHAEGNNTRAEAYGAHAEGELTRAFGENGHAEGKETQAGFGAHAEGRRTQATGDNSHAEGHTTEATAPQAHAEGKYTQATKDGAHAEGHSNYENQKNTASGRGSHAEGIDGTVASGTGAHAEGRTTTASGRASHAEGYGTVATEENQHVQGKFNYLDTKNKSGAYAHIIGNGAGETSRSNAHTIDWDGKAWFAGDVRIGGTDYNTGSTLATQAFVNDKANSHYVTAGRKSDSIAGSKSTAEGQNTVASEERAHAEGYQTQALGKQSHAEGRETIAAGSASHAEGRNTKAALDGSHAEGYGTTTTTPILASGFGAHAEGYGTIQAIGTGAHAEGYGSTASEEAAHSEGRDTVASGPRSHAEGYGAQATVQQAHAEGYYTQANGAHSHAEGRESVAEGSASHAEGRYTKASFDGAHAEGYGVSKDKPNLASGKGSHAEGVDGVIASGIGAHAEGQGTIASATAQHVSGRYNVEVADDKCLFIIGNGDSDNNRSNAVAIWAPDDNNDIPGHANFYGDISATGKVSADEINVQGASIRYNPEVSPDGEFELYDQTGTRCGLSTTYINTSLLKFKDIEIGVNKYNNTIILSGPPDYTDESEKVLLDGIRLPIADHNAANKKYVDESIQTAIDNLEIEGGSGVGQATETGGEIFNDYEHNEANGNYSHAEGLYTKAYAAATDAIAGAHAEGVWTVAGHQAAHSEGKNTQAVGRGAHAEGLGDYDHVGEFENRTSNIAHGDGSHVEGVHGTQAYYAGSHAEGWGSKAEGEAAHAEGMGTTAFGTGTHSEGVDTEVNGYAGHAEGQGTEAFAWAHAEGQDTKATSYWSHAEGYVTAASGNTAHSEGDHTLAQGSGAHSEGGYTKALGEYSHTEGIYYGHMSEGDVVYTVAKGLGSHAEGKGTQAGGMLLLDGTVMGDGAHSEGVLTFAGRYASHAEGEGTIAAGGRQHVQGRYNIPDVHMDADGNMLDRDGNITTDLERVNPKDTYAHIVGNGDSENNRSNAHTLDWSGNAWFAGKVTDGSGNSITKYTLSKTGSSIILKGSDGSISSVEDEVSESSTSSGMKRDFNSGAITAVVYPGPSDDPIGNLAKIYTVTVSAANDTFETYTFDYMACVALGTADSSGQITLKRKIDNGALYMYVKDDEVKFGCIADDSGEDQPLGYPALKHICGYY